MRPRFSRRFAMSSGLASRASHCWHRPVGCCMNTASLSPARAAWAAWRSWRCKASKNEVLAEIERRIPLHVRTRWHHALYSKEAGGDVTLLEWLREPPGNFSPSSTDRQYKKVKRLLDVLVDQYP